ncbi:MAG: M14 family metallopeptidase [Bryobacteraceae bacterium]
MPKLICLSLLIASTLAGQTKFEYWPGAKYDASIPTPKTILGFDFGDRIATHAQIVSYFQALATALPDQVKLFDYGQTWEGRRLIFAAIGSKANIRRLPEIQSAMKRLYDPRQTSEAESKRLITDLPAVIWLSYGVHGNEISSPDAAMVTAYHLLANRDNPVTDEILSNVVILIDPLQNPDGRDRFVQNFNQNEGPEPNADPLAAEHLEPWPGGRTNHYYFDLNRDWLAMTQPEISGQIQALRAWLPLVYVDLHEMGSESSYYFAPEAIPYNPHLVKEQQTNLYWFGKTNAKYFDQFGYSYFTREAYDAFYPGYGASWPSYYGALSMTYENGSTRGLVVRRNSDDTTITFRETVRRHFITSLGTCETAAVHREELLANFYRYHVTAIEEGKKEPIREYILPRRSDAPATDRLAALLVRHGVEVLRATAAFKAADGKEYAAGSYVIPTAQPAKRMVRVLLDTNVSMDEAFLTSEEHRRKRRESSEIYDVTAWSLPLQFGVEAITTGARSEGKFEPFQAAPAGRVEGGEATVAYLIPWGTAPAGRFLAAALKDGLRMLTTDRPFTQNGRTYPSGTVIIKVKDNALSVHESVRRNAESSGATVFATSSSWMDDGPNFGSQWVRYIRKPVIALAWDRPSAAGSAGQARFVIERQFGYPVTVVRTQQLATADLSKFSIILLPDAIGEGYFGVLGPAGTRRLKDWVESGGTLIGLGSGAVQFLADTRSGLLDVKQENAPGSEPPKPPPATPATGAPTPDSGRVAGKILKNQEEYDKAIQPDTDLPSSAHGFIGRAKVDTEHWLGAGAADIVFPMVAGRTIFTPLKADKGVNVAVYSGPDQVAASGYVWDEYRKQIAFKPFVIYQRSGRGNVIAFTSDPNFRAYLDGLNVLFLNSVFRSPAHAGVGGSEERE